LSSTRINFAAKKDTTTSTPTTNNATTLTTESFAVAAVLGQSTDGSSDNGCANGTAKYLAARRITSSRVGGTSGKG
jgi:hypothetical protein